MSIKKLLYFILNKSAFLFPNSFFIKLIKRLFDLIPDNLDMLFKCNFELAHIAIFFIWNKYYELSKRLTNISYV